MSEPKARKTFALPYTWDEIARIKVQMQVELLTSAQKNATDAGMAARRIGMNRNNYVITCKRLGIPIDHLIEQRHPRWNREEEAA